MNKSAQEDGGGLKSREWTGDIAAMIVAEGDTEKGEWKPLG